MKTQSINRKSEKYRLFVGLKKLGEFDSILDAKRFADNSNLWGAFNLIGKDNYRDSWYVFEFQIKKEEE